MSCTIILTTLLCAARLFEFTACVYTSSVILLLACLKSSWTVFTSSPFALSKVPNEWRKVCQPMFLWMPLRVQPAGCSAS